MLTGLNFFTFATEEFMSALNALASENKVNVLSSPSIMTAENKKAVINVSTSVPIVTGQQVPVATGGTTGNSITQQVEYRDAGIILTVTPRWTCPGLVGSRENPDMGHIATTDFTWRASAVGVRSSRIHGDILTCRSRRGATAPLAQAQEKQDVSGNGGERSLELSRRSTCARARLAPHPACEPPPGRGVS